MKIPFRHGIMRFQKDSVGNPLFLQKSNGGSSIDLVASPDPTVITIAHRGSNYLFEESKTVPAAWSGFESNVTKWMYIDINLMTARRTFGTTNVEPTYGDKSPINPPLDQHWFDTNLNVMCMKVWNGEHWVEKIRLFVASYRTGAILDAYDYGTQINIREQCDAGFILFDPEGKPVKRYHKRDGGEFFTTSSIFTTHTAKAVNISLDAINMTVIAAEPMPAFSLVSRDNEDGHVRLATYTKSSHPAIGMIQEDFHDGEVGIYTQAGYVYNELWNWTERAGTLLFLGENGQLTVTPTQTRMLQVVGEIASQTSIRLNIQPPIMYDDPVYTQYQNLIPMLLDKVTGRYIAAHIYPTRDGSSGINTTSEGFRHNQHAPDVVWTIMHAKSSVNFICQLFDENGDEIIPERTNVQDLNTLVITFVSPQSGFANMIFFTQDE